MRREHASQYRGRSGMLHSHPPGPERALQSTGIVITPQGRRRRRYRNALIGANSPPSIRGVSHGDCARGMGAAALSIALDRRRGLDTRVTRGGARFHPAALAKPNGSRQSIVRPMTSANSHPSSWTRPGILSETKAKAKARTDSVAASATELSCLPSACMSQPPPRTNVKHLLPYPSLTHGS